MRTVWVWLAIMGVAAPASAQLVSDAPAVSIRPFVLIAGEQFAAKKTFEAVLGGSAQPLWGGGVQMATRGGLFVDVTASRFKKDGERVFVAGGDVFPLGIPLTVTVTPLEVTGGYRSRVGRSGRLVPYVGAGVGWYGYKEESEFTEAGESVERRHVGYLAVGGVEYRVGRLIGVSVDVQYTHVGGILGGGGVSAALDEDDLGGVAARLRLIVGR
jgi:hypothetical protein